MKEQRKPSKAILAVFFFGIPSNLVLWGLSKTGLIPSIVQLPFLIALILMVLVVIVKASGFNHQEIPEKGTNWYGGGK